MKLNKAYTLCDGENKAYFKSNKMHDFCPFFFLLLLQSSKNMSLSIKDQLEIILLQEEKCQFNLFTSQTALDLGLMLIENAKPFNKPVVIDITLNGHQLFRYAMQGTNRDNDEWVRRKK